MSRFSTLVSKMGPIICYQNLCIYLAPYFHKNLLYCEINLLIVQITLSFGKSRERFIMKNKKKNFQDKCMVEGSTTNEIVSEGSDQKKILSKKEKLTRHLLFQQYFMPFQNFVDPFLDIQSLVFSQLPLHIKHYITLFEEIGVQFFRLCIIRKNVFQKCFYNSTLEKLRKLQIF